MSAEARAVHAAALIVDLHCDLLLPTHFYGWDWGRRHRPHPFPGAPLFGHCDLPRLKEGNLGCLALGVVVNPWWGGLPHIEGDLDELHRQAAAHDLVVATDAASIRAAHASGRLACFAGLEGAHALGGRLEALSGLRARGLRYVGLVHFTRNEAASPMVGWGADRHRGLSAYGTALVDELQRLDILVDVAHLNQAGVREVCARARRPVLCSHTACTAVHPSPRGIDDEAIRAVAATDGVVGIIFVTPFIGPGGARQAARHLDHVRRLVGVRHCGIGTDWEGFAVYPPDLAGADQLVNLTQALLDLGWSAEEVHAAYGENVLRLVGG